MSEAINDATGRAPAGGDGKPSVRDAELSVFVAKGELASAGVLAAYDDFLKRGPTRLVLWDLTSATVSRVLGARCSAPDRWLAGGCGGSALREEHSRPLFLGSLVGCLLQVPFRLGDRLFPLVGAHRAELREQLVLVHLHSPAVGRPVGQEAQDPKRGWAEDVDRCAEAIERFQELVGPAARHALRSRIVSQAIAREWPAARERLTPWASA
jgi:hypothetical protein